MPVITKSVKSLNNSSFWSSDIFICSSSFEKRCLTVPNLIDTRLVKKALIIENTNIEQIKKNSNILKKKFEKIYQSVEISTVNPLITADNLRKALENNLSKKKDRLKIIIDISTFTHESLLVLLNLLHLYLTTNNKITFVYNSASEYSIGLKMEDKWLSRGISGVRTVIGYPGDHHPTWKTHLILFVGYEYKRALKLIEILEPSSISLGYGEPGTATSQKNEEASDYFHAMVTKIAVKYADVDCVEFSCSDPFKVKETILNIANENKENNIIVAPMNTKLSTIGTAFAACEERRIQLCYSPATQYNFEDYSIPANSLYILEM